VQWGVRNWPVREIPDTHEFSEIPAEFAGDQISILQQICVDLHRNLNQKQLIFARRIAVWN
jgi:hypothetical protein